MSAALLKQKYPIMGRLPDESEGALTLCGAVESLHNPIVAFIRLAEGHVFSNALGMILNKMSIITIISHKHFNQKFGCWFIF